MGKAAQDRARGVVWTRCRRRNQTWGAGFLGLQKIRVITFAFQNIPPAGASRLRNRPGISCSLTTHRRILHKTTQAWGPERTASDLQETADTHTWPSGLGKRPALPY